jgi:hypothetical protein
MGGVRSHAVPLRATAWQRHFALYLALRER